jgi:hypothetical protein
MKVSVVLMFRFNKKKYLLTLYKRKILKENLYLHLYLYLYLLLSKRKYLHLPYVSIERFALYSGCPFLQTDNYVQRSSAVSIVIENEYHFKEYVVVRIQG